MFLLPPTVKLTLRVNKDYPRTSFYCCAAINQSWLMWKSVIMCCTKLWLKFSFQMYWDQYQVNCLHYECMSFMLVRLASDHGRHDFLLSSTATRNESHNDSLDLGHLPIVILWFLSWSDEGLMLETSALLQFTAMIIYFISFELILLCALYLLANVFNSFSKNYLPKFDWK